MVGEYRQQIRSHIPKHIFLGEKYAARLEQEIMDRRHELKINLADSEQFYLPLPLIFALDNRAAFDDFLWAGIFEKLFYGVDSAGNDNFYLQDSGGNKLFLTQGDSNAQRRGLEWALIRFCSQRDTQFDRLRSHIQGVAAQEKINRKSANRADYKNFLQGKFDNADLINQFIVFPGSGTGFRQMVTARHPKAVDFSELETLELILRVKLLEELGGL